MNKEQLKASIKSYQKKYPGTEFIRWNNANMYKWEYKMLIDWEYISSKGILANYPVLKVKKTNGEVEFKDLAGNLNYINEKVVELNNNGQNASVAYSAKGYDEYRKLKSDIDYNKKEEQSAIN